MACSTSRDRCESSCVDINVAAWKFRRNPHRRAVTLRVLRVSAADISSPRTSHRHGDPSMKRIALAALLLAAPLIAQDTTAGRGAAVPDSRQSPAPPITDTARAHLLFVFGLARLL